MVRYAGSGIYYWRSIILRHLIAAQIQGIMKHVVCAIPIAMLVSQAPGSSFPVIKASALHELVRNVAEIRTRLADPRILNIVYDLRDSCNYQPWGIKNLISSQCPKQL